MSECTHDCSTCGESCSSREPQSLLKAHHADAHIGKVYGIVSGKGEVIQSLCTLGCGKSRLCTHLLCQLGKGIHCIYGLTVYR